MTDRAVRQMETADEGRGRQTAIRLKLIMTGVKMKNFG